MMVETYETIHIPMSSLEYEESKGCLLVEVRVWWDQENGMQAEPIKYFAGTPQKYREGFPPRMRHDDMWAFVSLAVELEYTDTILMMIANEHPAFAPAREEMALEARMEIERHRRDVL